MRGRAARRQGPGLINTMARTAVIAGTATAVSGATSKAMHNSAQSKAAAQEAQIQAAVDQRLAEQQAPAPPPAAPEAAPPVASQAADTEAFDIRIAKLKELGALRDAGILTDEEFAAEKARILAG